MWTVRLLFLTHNQVLKAQAETVWRQATENGVPRIVFAKMDKIGADFLYSVSTLHDLQCKHTQSIANRCWEDDFRSIVTWSRWKLKSILTTLVRISLKKIFSQIPWPSSRIPWKLVEAVAEALKTWWWSHEGEEITNEELKAAIHGKAINV